MFKNMPWSSHEDGQKNHGEEEESLTSILHGDQRGELTLFIARITAAMRKTIESNFDASVSPLANASPFHPVDIARLAPLRRQSLRGIYNPKMRRL